MKFWIKENDIFLPKHKTIYLSDDTELLEAGSHLAGFHCMRIVATPLDARNVFLIPHSAPASRGIVKSSSRLLRFLQAARRALSRNSASTRATT
ncbi:hypothetical protein EVAR_39983_1 [Eumeta japonica]|uniref:Uncharacterized protein n=1 Tax=Eumeta variegata TaxID=151549 RepID=A0A4C1YHQ7_EUMVA|nr:hypothetical protein EVAR_39983_1 [Eumeta japonica]